MAISPTQSNKSESGIELERIRAVYARRRENVPLNYYSFFQPGNLFLYHSLERDLLKLFRRAGFRSLRDLRILDVGCGEGNRLRDFIRYGAQPENLYGVDLLEDRIRRAKALTPNINLICSNAEKLEFSDNFFDLVCQFTMFTSILNRNVRQRIASEMVRVVKPEGAIVSYDFRIANPNNRDVVAIGKKEICELFVGCSIKFKRVTLAPPILRRLAPMSWFLCNLLEKVPFLRTHYLVLIKKEGAT